MKTTPMLSWYVTELDQGPNSADCVALSVPETRLQMAKYDKAVAEGNKLTALTDKDGACSDPGVGPAR